MTVPGTVEPVIGHLKSEHRNGWNQLWHRQGDANNAVRAAAELKSGLFTVDEQGPRDSWTVF